jgi:hypothetical protein
MAVLWTDERLTPERMLRLLEEEHDRWIETAAAFERLKPYISGTFSLEDANSSTQNCRARAAYLEKLIKELRAQTQPPIPPPAEPAQPVIQ